MGFGEVGDRKHLRWADEWRGLLIMFSPKKARYAPKAVHQPPHKPPQTGKKKRKKKKEKRI